MKKRLLIICAVILVFAGGTWYYVHNRPYYIMHSQIDAIPVPAFRSANGSGLCEHIKEEYKTAFDVIYSNGEMNMEQTEKKLKEEGCVLLTTEDVAVKNGLTDSADQKKFEEFVRQCMAVHADNLIYSDPERFRPEQ